MLFIATCIDKPDSLAKRMGRRPAHLVYLSSLGAKVRAAGALLDPAGQNPVGSLLIFETLDEAEARALLAADPYAEAGCSPPSTSSLGARRSASRSRGEAMAHWLVKSEPSAWSFADQIAAGDKGTSWNGVRNHAAKLNLMAMKVGEEAFFYHSNEGKAIVGVVAVTKSYYPDPSDESGRFGMVDFKAVRALERPVTLERSRPTSVSPR